MPLPMNSAAKRFGRTVADSPPQAESDSSQGRAIATPTPRSKVRRSIGGLNALTARSPRLLAPSRFTSMLSLQSQGIERNRLAGFHLLNQAEDFFATPARPDFFAQEFKPVEIKRLSALVLSA